MYGCWKREMSDRASELFDRMRNKCLSRGCGGIKDLAVVFRKMDIDYSKRLSKEELKNGTDLYGLQLNDSDVNVLFVSFDMDENKTIDFSEFLFRLRPKMSRERQDVIMESFDKLDANGDGHLNLDDLKVVYAANARNHPKYLSGEWTEDEVLRSFLDSIDTPGSPDGKVTRDEFMNYYAGVSATIDDDCYFDLMMRSCYGLPQRSSQSK
ncbi:calcyphosin-like protein isoform X1 [Saccostrea cucullata]|uniref:calcyphosin-like protein isoform X1 n=1 Tax=Saccostrea cuccullata TaxID=36930 RepID=UPI002ED1CFDB